MSSWIEQGLSGLASEQLRRTLRPIEQMDQGRLLINGKSYRNFSSNNYLGLARHPQVVDAVKQVLDHWGAGATASRLISGTSTIHRDLEQALAAFVGKEAALVFPSGYMTNLGVISALVGPGDAVILDRLCHASLVDAVRLSGARLLIYAHADVREAERALKRALPYLRRLLVTDSLFSMDGDFAPLQELTDLCRHYDAMSLVDEAHAIGVWGRNGNGLSSECRFDVVVGTLSKALGSQGGFVGASQEIIDWVINKGRSFIYTTGLSPACIAAAHAALSIVQEDPARRHKVQRLAVRLREGLTHLGYDLRGSQSQIIPIFLGEVDQALACSRDLEAQDIFAPAIRPPTVHAGQCRIRFSVMADHTEEDVDYLLDVLSKMPSFEVGEKARRILNHD